MKILAIAALVGLAVIGTRTEALAAARSCLLVSKMGDQLQRTPMPGFDPAKPGPLALPKVGGQMGMILCSGGTVLPEPKDYRVPAELKMPIGYTDGQKEFYLAADNGQLEFLFDTEGPPPIDQAKAQALLDQMQKAMAQSKPR